MYTVVAIFHMNMNNIYMNIAPSTGEIFKCKKKKLMCSV